MRIPTVFQAQSPECDSKTSGDWDTRSSTLPRKRTRGRARPFARVSLPRLALIAISQRLAMLRARRPWLPSISARARAESLSLPSMNQRKACVSSSRFIPGKARSPQAARRSHRAREAAPLLSRNAGDETRPRRERCAQLAGRRPSRRPPRQPGRGVAVQRTGPPPGQRRRPACGQSIARRLRWPGPAAGTSAPWRSRILRRAVSSSADRCGSLPFVPLNAPSNPVGDAPNRELLRQVAKGPREPGRYSARGSR